MAQSRRGAKGQTLPIEGPYLEAGGPSRRCLPPWRHGLMFAAVFQGQGTIRGRIRIRPHGLVRGKSGVIGPHGTEYIQVYLAVLAG